MTEPLREPARSPQPAATAAQIAPAEEYAHIHTSELVQLSGAALKWGILGLAFGATFSVSPIGIAFSIVSLRYARRYARRNGRLNGRARVAHRMAKIGLIAGIALTLLQVAALLLMIKYGRPALPLPHRNITI